MGASVRPDPVADYLAALKPASDPVHDYLSSLPPKAHDYHAEFKSGALDRRMQAANQRDTASAKELDATGEAGQPGIAGSIADATQAIPGMAALQAGGRALVRGQSYHDAYNDIKGRTDKVPTSAKLIGRGAVSAPLALTLPGSAAASGAMLGGADQVLDADPDKGIGARVATGALGAAAGGLLGKAAEIVPTGIRAGLATNAAKNVFGRMANRADIAGKMFPDALASGQGKIVPPAVHAFLQEPEIASLVGRLQETSHQGVRAESPEMLDAVNKVLSDQAGMLKKGQMALDPSKPNTGRFGLDRLSQLKNQLYAAVGKPTTIDETHLPAMMPTYPAANHQFADASKNLDAFKTGYTGLDNAERGSIPTAKQLTKKTPEAFTDLVGRMGDPEKAAGIEGVLGRAKAGVAQNILLGGARKNPFTGLGTLSTTPGLLRTLGDKPQSIMDVLTKAGLLGVNAEAAP